MSIWKFYMKIKILTLSSLLTFTLLVHAENHMLIMGGGGEPSGDITIFDSTIVKLGQNLQSSKWNYQVSFNGGHKTTEEILSNQFPKSSTPITNFSSDNYEKLISNYIEKINNDEIKSGDQLMIIVNSHGASAIEGELTHRIATSGAASKNFDTLAGASIVNLDDLQKIIKLTEQKGIKLGIIDLSCHSGTSLALKKAIEPDSPNTCIITSTGPEHYSFAGQSAFGENFVEELKPGENLQDIFLKARARSPFAEYPMISTEMNDKIVEAVYEGITPYLYYNNLTYDKLTPYILNNSQEDQICKREEIFKNLISNIDDFSFLLDLNDTETIPEVPEKQQSRFIWPFSKLIKKNKTKQLSTELSLTYTETLKNLLLEYKESQNKVFEAVRKTDTAQLNNIEKFNLTSTQPNTLINLKTEYSWKELLSMDIDKDLQAYIKWQNNETSERRKGLIQEGINFLNIVNERKNQITIEHPSLSTLKEDTEALTKNIQNSKKLSQDISKQERILYDALYKKYENDNTNSKNPCKQMTF